jgi:hypothetical protein
MTGCQGSVKYFFALNGVFLNISEVYGDLERDT